jgi:hypothetical protein
MCTALCHYVDLAVIRFIQFAIIAFLGCVYIDIAHNSTYHLLLVLCPNHDPAIHSQSFAGDKGGFVGGQKQVGIGDITRFA